MTAKIRTKYDLWVVVWNESDYDLDGAVTALLKFFEFSTQFHTSTMKVVRKWAWILTFRLKFSPGELKKVPSNARILQNVRAHGSAVLHPGDTLPRPLQVQFFSPKFGSKLGKFCSKQTLNALNRLQTPSLTVPLWCSVSEPFSSIANDDFFEAQENCSPFISASA